MAVTIKQLGIKVYLNRVYGDAGGADRLIDLLQKGWPIKEIAREFGVDRRTIPVWKKELEESNGK